MRHATIVKCDIVESTRIWRTLDPSDYLGLSRAFKKSIEEVVARHGGSIERWEGDGALVAFGYPGAREDAPEAAVRAGLEMVEVMPSLESRQIKLKLRVGIASGEVAVDLEDQSLEGPTINAAERLKAIAEPGWVVISDATKRLAKSFFEYDDLGVVQAKGFEEGLRAWRAIRRSMVVSRFEAQRVESSSRDLVGRATVLEALAEAWSKSRKGEGQIVFLIGDAGLGKSRLARAVLDWSVQDKAVRMEVDCTPGTTYSPLFPIGVLFRRNARIDAIVPEAERRERAVRFLGQFFEEDDLPRVLGHLAPLFGVADVPLPDIGGPEKIRDETISIIVAMLRQIATRGPMVLLCEDLHWADDTTIELVQRIAGALRKTSGMLIMTARTNLSTSFDTAKLQGAYTEIELQPLEPAAASDLVGSMEGAQMLSPELVNSIVDRCEGVPLILEEVTRSVLESTKSGGSFSFASVSKGPVPAPLQLVVESRLERWGHHKPIVQAASVLGREFSVALLQEMLEDRSGEVEAAIDRFAASGLLVPRSSTSSDRVRFSHAMIRDAVYQTLLRDDRRARHSRAADAIRLAFQGSADGTPDVLAQHLVEAARFEESVETRLSASSDTVARGAYVETEGHCEAALKFVDRIADSSKRRMLQFRLLVQMGVALTGRHGYAAQQVENVYRKAREVCGETAEAAMLYPIFRGLTALNLVRGNLATGYELSILSMEVAERSMRSEFRIDAMSVHCYATMYFRSLKECRDWIEQSLSLYRDENGGQLTYPVPNDPRTAALAILPTIEWLLGDSQAAEDAIVEGLRHVNQTSRDFDKAYMHAWIAGTRLTQRRYAECIEHAQLAVGIAQKGGFREWYVTGLLLDQLAQALVTGSADALKVASDTCTAMAGEGVGLNASWYLWALAGGYRRAGLDAVAGHVLEQASERARLSGETRMNAELLMAKAQLQSEPIDMIRMLISALRISDEQGALANSLRAAALLVLASSDKGVARQEAESVLDWLEGRTAYPSNRNWMAEHLEVLRNAAAGIPGLAAAG